ncbi:MAG TPA: aldo/keto reductase [Thermoanaerobaculia bacterium]
MRKRVFGQAGSDVAVIGQGTWAFERGDRKAAIAAIHRGLDLGMTHVDTAEMYGQGRVEELLGEALAGRRDEVFLVSKVLPENATHRGTIAACDRSLRRLRTDRLDVYLLHWPSSHPLAGTIAAFEELVAAGKSAAWGVSNFDEDLLAQAVEIAGPGRIACNQVLYHLEERRIEHAVLPFCERHGIAVVAYSPLGNGSFPGPRTAGGATLADVAVAHHATPHQVALAFLTRRPSLFAIPKAARLAHAQENAGAGDLVLSDDEIARLDAAFPLGRRRHGIATA